MTIVVSVIYLDYVVFWEFMFHNPTLQGKATNVIKFNARGLNMLNGQLTIQASFKVASVSVTFYNNYAFVLLLVLHVTKSHWLW